MRKAIIKDKLYGNTIHVTFGTTEEVKKWYKKEKVKGEIKLSEFNDAFCYQIEFKEKEFKFIKYHLHFCNYGFTTIIHETHHLTHHVLKGVGMELSDETAEAYAYYQEWIAREIRDLMEKWKK